MVGTTVSPSWDAIAKLASIRGIRTFLNFFYRKKCGRYRRWINGYSNRNMHWKRKKMMNQRSKNNEHMAGNR
ncbi:DUF1622 domain-containing protein [Stenomitos frigidus]|uniref:Uncharacterized protein n=1 Tax=Stenomitos frigidus ULC18 TaxID=2107698 RepID=A0A2T1EN25_9CYAN|nr:hypothetical protein C7B82_03200 [Stenomitos frigidus ULC18]